MKRNLLLLLITSFTFFNVSCSKDDDSSSSNPTSNSLSVKINGTLKTFNSITVAQNTQNQGTVDEFTLLEVTASNSSNEKIKFGVEKNDVGNDVLWYLKYIVGSMEYDSSGFDSSNFTTNSNNNLAGTFSGEMTNISGGTDTVQLTEGTFNFQY